MTFATSRKISIPGQRGFWLRCFLKGAFWIWLCVAGGSALNAQVDVPGPERLSHVVGIVVNPGGRAAVDVEVTLKANDKVVHRTRTGKAGDFRFDAARGDYTFHVARSEYAPAVREIVVTDEIVTALERKKLYVILGPGACADACSAVLTNKKQFEREIRENTKR
jgi:hypothetical protein